MASNNLLELLYGQKPSSDAAVGYPSARKYAAAKKRAEQADVNTLPDPKTYAAVQSFLGTAPDQLGFSALHPKAGEIRDVADKAYALGLLTNVAPMTKGLPVGATIKPYNTLYHGGTYTPGSEIKKPLFTSPNKQLASSYLYDDYGNLTGKLSEMSYSAQNPANEEKLLEVAKKLGIKVDEANVPLSLLDKNLYGQKDVNRMLAALKRQGYDSAEGIDIGAGTSITDKAVVLFPGTKTTTVGGSAPAAPDQPFWHNPATGAHETFDLSGMHNAVIQDPAYAAKLGVTTEEAMQPSSTLLMGRTERKNPEALNLMQVAPPTPESIEAIKKMLISQQLPHKTVNFSAGENLFEGIPVDELLKAEGLSPLKSYQQYAMGGSVNIPDDFTTPDMSDGGAILPDTEYVRSPLQQVR